MCSFVQVEYFPGLKFALANLSVGNSESRAGASGCLRMKLLGVVRGPWSVPGCNVRPDRLPDVRLPGSPARVRCSPARVRCSPARVRCSPGSPARVRCSPGSPARIACPDRLPGSPARIACPVAMAQGSPRPIPAPETAENRPFSHFPGYGGERG